MTKDISIIIPHYKCERGLQELLNSILSPLDKTCVEKIEIIVIDDNSMDIEAYGNFVNANECVQFFRNNASLNGAGSARNMGLDIARGKYIIFADSDDLFLSDWYDALNKIILLDSDITYFSPKSMKSNGEPSRRHLRYKKLVENYIEENSNAIRYKYHVPWSKVYLKKFLDKYNIRFDEVIASNDVMFSLKAGIHAEKISCYENSFYIVVEREGSLTTSKNYTKLVSRINVLLDYNLQLKRINQKTYCISLVPHLLLMLKISPIKTFKLILRIIKCGHEIIYLNYIVRAFICKMKFQLFPS
ncbi:glycosyltransferase family 2 protein [Aeromonas veronii]